MDRRGSRRRSNSSRLGDLPRLRPQISSDQTSSAEPMSTSTPPFASVHPVALLQRLSHDIKTALRLGSARSPRIQPLRHPCLLLPSSARAFHPNWKPPHHQRATTAMSSAKAGNSIKPSPQPAQRCRSSPPLPPTPFAERTKCTSPVAKCQKRPSRSSPSAHSGQCQTVPLE